MQHAPHVVLVAGPGRSGTSLFTGLLSRLGYHVPKPEVSAGRTNPRGFSEPRWAVDFHNTLLEKAAIAVDDSRPEAWQRATSVGERKPVYAELREWLGAQLAESPRVVVKDPRIGWFLDLYRRVGEDLGAQTYVVTLLRDPAEVLRSRELAYGTRTTPSVRALGWVNMMLGVEEHARDIPHAVVRYADLLTDWQTALTDAGTALGLDLVTSATPDQIASAAGLVDPSLLRSAADWSEMEVVPRAEALTRSVYQTYGDLVGVPDAAALAAGRAALAQAAAELTAYYDECWEISSHRRRRLVRRERRKAVAAERARVAGEVTDKMDAAGR
ncbi:MAG: sulfotransferase family protein [Nocardioides sp.]|uniref:sulfotransferase family protein n=1 Tax=Nocardioides sp. TaxID=35761 RepID=UPI0039E6A234